MNSTVINTWLLWAPCIILGALSGYLSERVGVVNIGINGIMVVGALFFCIFSNVFASAIGESSYGMFIITMLLSAGCTVIVGVLFAFAAVTLKADNVVVGTAINLFASGFGLIVAGFAPALFQTTDIKNQCQKILLIESSGIFGSSIIAFFFAIILCLGIWFVMNYTKLGLRYRACGENPNAIYDQGVSVTRYQFFGIMFASFIAGLGGTFYAYDSVAFTGDVYGFGFIALALMIISAWKVLPIIAVGALFSLLLAYTKSNTATAHPYLLRMVPYILAIVAMAAFGRFVRPPAHVGIPFDKSFR